MNKGTAINVVVNEGKREGFCDLSGHNYGVLNDTVLNLETSSKP